MPYPGYSWSMTQHIGPAADHVTMYELLRAAQLYSSEPNYQERITQHLIDHNVLTPNVRRDAQRPQAWRDYQQILPELGLIISTRFTRGVTVTPIGLMWLDGIAGFSEMLTTQCLRYQYPNGHKQDFSPVMRRLLTVAGIDQPATRTELDTKYGVLIKPAVLILRALIVLFDELGTNGISTKECLAALVPIRSHQNSDTGIQELLRLRDVGIQPLKARNLRHIQEWFRLLNLTDIFQVINSYIYLTDTALENLVSLRDLCDYHEDPSTFWIPTVFSPQSLGLSWFSHFGNPDIHSQWEVPENQRDLDYYNQNYPGGVEDSEDWGEPEVQKTWNSRLNLREFDPTQHTQNSDVQGPINVNTGNIVRGQIRRQRSTRLHEEIVRALAEKLQGMGYTVFDDPSSVDLIARSGDREAILEVKTVTPRSLVNRIRLGLGQLSEYRYRRTMETGNRPEGILVLSSTRNFSEWYTQFLQTDLLLGLVCRDSMDSFVAHTSVNIEHELSA